MMQRALRLKQFPIQAFVGMISDEIESLRKRGETDDQIASLIRIAVPLRSAPLRLRRITRLPRSDIITVSR